MVFDIILWLFVGFLSVLGICKLAEGKVRIRDMFLAVILSFGGPILLVPLLVLAIIAFMDMDKPWMDKKLF